ncbi:YfiT family bacillithiol transferase [Paenibacillus protaetiae]|uniref:Putative metal-dependent hydrolase ET464_05815 n=1 Tax=Paenibacillus protaetiae TaxID=2509456 RepID=A0A4P6ETK8_9BACL|nr:bacillithiol transferase BstA [Paenibacillus protaetiae]QAY65976.1 putative metal-dependent hydrolase [Paenibacillus protaetiae]
MDVRYPIGTFEHKGDISGEQLQEWIRVIAGQPAKLREAVAGLNEEQLDTPYRDGGWTIRQVVHHLADSHMNCYIRFKLALTEDTPVIKTYEEQLWAELEDGRTMPAEVSLVLFEQLHARWEVLLHSLTAEQWGKAFAHPVNGLTRLDYAAGLYAWHGNHHIRHITALRERMNW